MSHLPQLVTLHTLKITNEGTFNNANTQLVLIDMCKHQSYENLRIRVICDLPLQILRGVLNSIFVDGHLLIKYVVVLTTSPYKI